MLQSLIIVFVAPVLTGLVSGLLVTLFGYWLNNRDGK